MTDFKDEFHPIQNAMWLYGLNDQQLMNVCINTVEAFKSVHNKSYTYRIYWIYYKQINN